MSFKNFGIIIKEVWSGKTILRTKMNLALRDYVLRGTVVDIGGGQSPSYLRFFQKQDGLVFKSFDFQADDKDRNFDLETTPLPYEPGSVGQILLFNILEHIYNHNFVLSEASRILKPGGEVFGFVPFFAAIHPDPHDHWRYTRETLEKIFIQAGFSQVKIQEIGGGPVLVSYNILMIYWPRFLRLLFLPVFWLLDRIMLGLKPALRQKFPLGYLFILKK